MRRPGLGVFARQAEDLQAELSHARGSFALGASALTAAELRLLPMLSTHLSFPEIAEEMFLSPHGQVVDGLDLPEAGGLFTQSGGRSIECGAFRVPGELLLANGRSRQPTRSLPDQPSSRAYAASNRQLAGPGPAVRPARFASPSPHPPEGAAVPGCGLWCGRSAAAVPGCGPR